MSIRTNTKLVPLSASLVLLGVTSMAMDQTPGGSQLPGKNLRQRTRAAVPTLPAPAPSPAPVSFCAGDGSTGACPCGNEGLPGHGCDNSAQTGGSLLVATGGSHIAMDTLQLGVTGELPNALSVVLQGTGNLTPSFFGDGLLCAGGNVKRLYVLNATGGALQVPRPGEQTISERSVALGDPLPNGGVRYYQVYYRDRIWKFCQAPAGGEFNVSNGVAVTWVK